MSDAQDSRVGSMFGPYHLKRLLGRGGMGEVYEAEHTVKEWTVAVKLMTAEFSKDPVFRERMKREARIAGRLQEPHVVPIHDYGEVDGQMFLEMRLVEGTDLDSVLKRFGPLTPPRAVAIITQIASALDAAHADGVMHRDVKPQNILITRDDFAYLVDFGIASATTDEKLTQLGTAVGTWKYMAPERFSNDEVTYRADIYALACVLHECLTGAPPYRADSAGTLVSSHLMGPIPQPSAIRPGIPKAFDAVVARGMAKKPEDRYASAGDLALAAHEALSDPDQDHAADILRRSQESTLPAPPKSQRRRIHPRQTSRQTSGRQHRQTTCHQRRQLRRRHPRQTRQTRRQTGRGRHRHQVGRRHTWQTRKTHAWQAGGRRHREQTRRRHARQGGQPHSRQSGRRRLRPGQQQGGHRAGCSAGRRQDAGRLQRVNRKHEIGDGHRARGHHPRRRASHTQDTVHDRGSGVHPGDWVGYAGDADARDADARDADARYARRGQVRQGRWGRQGRAGRTGNVG